MAETDIDRRDRPRMEDRGWRIEDGGLILCYRIIRRPFQFSFLDSRPSILVISLRSSIFGPEQVTQQRMPRLPQPEPAIRGDIGGRHGIIAAITGLGGDQVDLCYHIDGAGDSRRNFADVAGNAAEHTTDLPLLFPLE